MHWLFSDRPLYCFQEFTRKHPRNKRAEMLQRLPNLDEAVRRGVGVDSPLLPHLCIRGWNGHSMPAFKALLKKNPDYLEIRTPTGLTPLHTAALCKRIDAIRVLISEGANVYARDDHGRNAIHFALNSLQKLEEFFACFTEGCLRGLFTRRASGMTPLYSFMNQHPRRVDMLKIVLKACNGIGLDIINGDGNLPIHKVSCPRQITLRGMAQYLTSTGCQGRRA